MRIAGQKGLSFVGSVFNRADKSEAIAKGLRQLSSGKRINSAADDAAGLSISQKLTAKIRGNNQAKKNIGDGLSMLGTIEGSLTSVQENMQRIRELLVLGKSETNSSNELDAMQREINSRVEIIDEIGRNTRFNGQRLIWGNWTNDYNIDIQIGADNNQTHTVLLRAGPSNVPAGTGVEIAVADGNTADAGELNDGLPGIRFDSIHLDGATVNSYWSSTTNNSASRNHDITLDEMDVFIGNVSRMRTFIGTEVNRLEAQLDSLDVTIENQESSKQRIEDLDFAKASAELTKNQIQQQSAVAILSQAQNIQRDIVLSLIP